MASEKIKSSDIFDDDIFKKVKLDADAFKGTLDALQKEFQTILEQQRKFLSKKSGFNEASDIKNTTQAIEKSKQARQGLSAVQRQLTQLQDAEVKGKIRFNQANKKQRQELTDLIALENKQAETLNTLLARNRQLRRERADINLKTAEGKKRISEINAELDKNNKLIRRNSDALKKQRLNVGNYTSAIKGAVGKLRNLASAFGLVAGAAGVVSVFRDAIGIFRTFEQVQTDLASILQQTTAETEALSDAAKDLGATTFFTATEVSKLQVELAKLGFDNQQILDSEAAILDLAAAFSIDLPRAAKVVAGTLNGFNLDAKESGRVSDVLAKSFANSALDIEKFEVAISKVAPIAAGLNVDIETTTAVLGQLTNANFDASTAGTQFRNILLKLSNPASELANTLGFTVNNSDDLVNSLKTLNKEQLTVAEAQGLIDVRSVALLKNLSDNVDAVEELRGELELAGGTAKDIANNQLKTLNGSFRLLSSAYEGFILSLDDGGGVISEFLKSISQVVTGVFNLLTNTEKTRESFALLSPEVRRISENIVSFFRVLKDVVATIFDLRRVILSVIIAWKSYTIAVSLANKQLGLFNITTKGTVLGANTLNGALKRLSVGFRNLGKAIASNPLGLVAALFATVAANVFLFADATKAAAEENSLLLGSEQDLKDALNDVNDIIERRLTLLDQISPEEAFNTKSLAELRQELSLLKTEISTLDEEKVVEIREDIIKLFSEGKFLSDVEGKLIDQTIDNTKAQELLGNEYARQIKELERLIKDKEKLLGLDKEETGILNKLRADLKKVRGERDLALSEKEIEIKNKRIKAIQEEIKRLESLGEAEKELAKIRLSLDKFILVQRTNISRSFRDLQEENKNKALADLEDELETFENAFSDVLNAFDKEERATKTVGKGLFARRVAITEEDKDEVKAQLREISEAQDKSIQDIANKRKEILDLQFAFEKKSIEDSAGLRDIELEKQKQRLEKALGLTDKSEEEKKAIIAKSSQDVKDSFNEIAEAQKVSETRKNKELLTAKTAYQNEVSAVDKQAAKDTFQNAEDTAAALVKIDADVADARTELLIKQISDTEKFVQDLLSIYQDKADKQNEIERKRLDEEVRLTEKAADRQFERAIRGQDNIYEFQEQKAVEARNRQFKAEKDAQKREEALRLASIYFSALQVRLAEAATQANEEKDGGKKATVTTTTAPFLALKDAFLAEAIAGSLAGAFATGVENFQGKGTGTSDSNLIAFSHGESVVTAKGTAENAGLTTAMNEGRVDDYFARVWLPKFDMDNSTRNITKTVKKDDTNYKLLNEIRDLKNVMASRPVQQVHVDSFGNIIETSYKNGLKTTISHQMKKPL